VLVLQVLPAGQSDVVKHSTHWWGFLRSQRAVGAGQSSSWTQGSQVPVAAEQCGAEPGHSSSDVHTTQTLRVRSQWGRLTSPRQSASCVQVGMQCKSSGSQTTPDVPQFRADRHWTQ
jgi:hypothetical protein